MFYVRLSTSHESPKGSGLTISIGAPWDCDSKHLLWSLERAFEELRGAINAQHNMIEIIEDMEHEKL